jgi:hypothetical protein
LVATAHQRYSPPHTIDAESLEEVFREFVRLTAAAHFARLAVYSGPLRRPRLRCGRCSGGVSFAGRGDVAGFHEPNKMTWLS